MNAKAVACGVMLDDPVDPPPECTPALAAERTCVAACYDQASCEALKGEDLDGALDFGICVVEC